MWRLSYICGFVEQTIPKSPGLLRYATACSSTNSTVAKQTRYISYKHWSIHLQNRIASLGIPLGKK